NRAVAAVGNVTGRCREGIPDGRPAPIADALDLEGGRCRAEDEAAAKILAREAEHAIRPVRSLEDGLAAGVEAVEFLQPRGNAQRVPGMIGRLAALADDDRLRRPDIDIDVTVGTEV